MNRQDRDALEKHYAGEEGICPLCGGECTSRIVAPEIFGGRREYTALPHEILAEATVALEDLELWSERHLARTLLCLWREGSDSAGDVLVTVIRRRPAE